MQSVRGMKVVLSTLLAACLALLLSAAPGADAVDVTTVFDLYGSSVEPFDNGKQDAVKKAIAQAAGHGVSQGDVQVSVTKRFSDQKSGRRLLQDGRLVQAGVELQTVVQTDAQNAQPVQTAIKNSLAQPYQLVNVYKSNGGQADYTFFVSSDSGGGSSSGGSPPGDSSSGNTNSAPTGGSSSSGSSGKSFPAWAAALVAILVVALVALVAGYCLYKRWWKRRQAKGTDNDFGGGAGYFSGSKSTGKSPLVKLQSSSSSGAGDAAMGNPAPKFQSAPLNNATSDYSSPLDGFRGFLGTRPQTAPDNPGRTTPSPHAATPSRPSWATPIQDPIQEEPAENTMSGFASTTSTTTSIPRGAGVPRGEEYAPYAPSRAGRLMSFLRGGG